MMKKEDRREPMNHRILVDQLHSIDWSFEGEDSLTDTHGLHPYPAKFPPQIPATILETVLKNMKISRVLDPFGGSGTTALESAKLGIKSTSNDLNKITQVIAYAKLLKPNNEEEKILSDHISEIVNFSVNKKIFSRTVKSNTDDIADLIPSIPNIEKWFSKQVQLELAVIKLVINKLQSARLQRYCLAILSSIITTVSFQAEETRYSSKPREINFGETLKTYSSKFKSSLLTSNRLLHDFTSYVDLTSKDMRIEEGFDDTFEICITSPPYPNVTDYHLYHRHRNFWLGQDPVKFGKSEIGSHLRHQKENTGFQHYIDEMAVSLSNIEKSLVHGGLMFMVVGSGIFKGIEYDTSKSIIERASQLGFRHITTITRDLPKNKRTFTVAGRRASKEDIVVMEKFGGASS
jgi:hypothetical protein